MAVKKATLAPGTARRHLVDFSHSNMDLLIDPARVEHWTHELLKFGVKPDELRKAIATLDVVNGMRDTDLVAQKEMATEFRANCDAIIVIASPELHSSTACLTRFQRPLLLGTKPEVFFEKPQANTAWLNSLLQHLLQEGARLGAVIMKFGAPHPLVEAAQASLEEIIGLRHGAEEAQRRILIVGEANAPGRDTYRKLTYPDRLARPFSLFSAVGCLPLFLAGLDANQFAEGARSLCRSIEKSYGFDEPAVQFTATRLHLIAERNLRELFLTSDPGLEPLGKWWESIMEPSSLALGNPTPGSISRDYFDPGLIPTDPISDFAVSLEWEEDDSPGHLIDTEEFLGKIPSLPLMVRKRDAFSLGATCAFLSCSASMTHRLINLPFAK
jgi:hypothetical protein